MLFFSETVRPRLVTPMHGDETGQRQRRLRGDSGKNENCRGKRPVQSLFSDLLLFGTTPQTFTEHT